MLNGQGSTVLTPDTISVDLSLSLFTYTIAIPDTSVDHFVFRNGFAFNSSGNYNNIYISSIYKSINQQLFIDNNDVSSLTDSAVYSQLGDNDCFWYYDPSTWNFEIWCDSLAITDTLIVKFLSTQPTNSGNYIFKLEELTQGHVGNTQDDNIALTVLNGNDIQDTIVVIPGDAIEIEVSTNSGSLVQPSTINISADDDTSFYSFGFDRYGNSTGRIITEWSVIGNIGSVSADSSDSIVFDPDSVASGLVQATIVDMDTATSGLINVLPGIVNYIKVLESSDGNIANEHVGPDTMTTDETLALWSAGYDTDGNFVENVISTWGLTDSLSHAGSIGSASTFVFNPDSIGAGYISALSAGKTDSTGLIRVELITDPDNPPLDEEYFAKIIDSSTETVGSHYNTHSEVLDHPMTTDDTLSLYAAGYNPDSLLVGYVSGTWSRTGSLDNVNDTGTSYTFLPNTSGTSGTIEIAVTGYNPDGTGTITVGVGIVNYIKVLESSDGNIANEHVGPDTMTTDETLALWSAGYDTDGNFVENVISTWGLTDSLSHAGSIGSASTFVFNPDSIGAGYISALSAGKTDSTGLIRVEFGTINEIKIVYTDTTLADSAITLNVTNTRLYRSAAYDKWGNFINFIDANWLVEGDIGSLSGNDTVTFTALTPGTGYLRATVDSSGNIFGNVTGSIEVVAANPDRIIIEYTDGTAVTDTTIPDYRSLTMHAAGYSGEHYTGDVTVRWYSDEFDLSLSDSTKTLIFSAFPDSAITGTISTISDSITNDTTGTITVLKSPGLHYISSTLKPTVVNWGMDTSFTLQLWNNSQIPIMLETDSEFSFTDENERTFSTNLISPIIIEKDSTRICTFISDTIPHGFQTGYWRPNFIAVGTDSFGITKLHDIFVNDEIFVSAVTIDTLITLNQVFRGQQDIELDVQITNYAGEIVSIDSISAHFGPLSNGSQIYDDQYIYSYPTTLDIGPDNNGTGVTDAARLIISVDDTATLGDVYIWTKVYFTIGGNQYEIDNPSDPITWEVVGLPSISISPPGSLKPNSVITGQPNVVFELSLLNAENAANLYIDSLKIFLNDSIPNPLVFFNPPILIQSDSTKTILFDSVSISITNTPNDPTVLAGNYPVTLKIFGRNTIDTTFYSDTLSNFDILTVLNGPKLDSIPNSLFYNDGNVNPPKITMDDMVFFSFNVENVGETVGTLLEGSSLIVNNNYYFLLDDSSYSIPLGPPQTIQTESDVITGLDVGVYPVKFDYTMIDPHGTVFPGIVALDSVTILNYAELDTIFTPENPDSVSLGEIFTLDLVINNVGGSEANIDSVQIFVGNNIDNIDTGYDIYGYENPISINPDFLDTIQVEVYVGSEVETNNYKNVFTKVYYHDDVHTDSLVRSFDSWYVRGKSVFQIDSITVSQDTVTAGQISDWQVFMHVINKSKYPVILDTASISFYSPNDEDTTYILKKSITTEFNDSEFSLEKDSTTVISFVVDTTGQYSGSNIINIAGNLSGMELVPDTVTSIIDTVIVPNDFTEILSPESGEIYLIKPGILELYRIIESQSEVDSAQNDGRLNLKIVIRNIGEASLFTTFYNTDTTLVFSVEDSVDSNYIFTPLVDSSTVDSVSFLLSAFVKDTLTIRVDTVGSHMGWVDIDSLVLTAIDSNDMDVKHFFSFNKQQYELQQDIFKVVRPAVVSIDSIWFDPYSHNIYPANSSFQLVANVVNREAENIDVGNMDKVTINIKSTSSITDTNLVYNKFFNSIDNIKTIDVFSADSTYIDTFVVSVDSLNTFAVNTDALPLLQPASDTIIVTIVDAIPPEIISTRYYDGGIDGIPDGNINKGDVIKIFFDKPIAIDASYWRQQLSADSVFISWDDGVSFGNGSFIEEEHNNNNVIFIELGENPLLSTNCATNRHNDQTTLKTVKSPTKLFLRPDIDFGILKSGTMDFGLPFVRAALDTVSNAINNFIASDTLAFSSFSIVVDDSIPPVVYNAYPDNLPDNHPISPYTNFKAFISGRNFVYKSDLVEYLGQLVGNESDTLVASYLHDYDRLVNDLKDDNKYGPSAKSALKDSLKKYHKLFSTVENDSLLINPLAQMFTNINQFEGGGIIIEMNGVTVDTANYTIEYSNEDSIWTYKTQPTYNTLLTNNEPINSNGKNVSYKYQIQSIIPGNNYTYDSELIINAVNAGRSEGDYYIWSAPNPYLHGRDNLTIEYAMGNQQNSLEVYIIDSAGRIVKKWLLSGEYGSKGIHRIPNGWDGKNENGLTVSRGVYLLYLKINNSIRSSWVLLVE